MEQAGIVVQVVEHLLSKCKTLNLNPSIREREGEREK
jgi:hypothetical protein